MSVNNSGTIEANSRVEKESQSFIPKQEPLAESHSESRGQKDGDGDGDEDHKDVMLIDSDDDETNINSAHLERTRRDRCRQCFVVYYQRSRLRQFVQYEFAPRCFAGTV